MFNKKTSAVLVAAILFSGSVQALDNIKTLNSIAAEVNGNIITYQDIERRAKQIASTNDTTGVTPEQIGMVAKQDLVERLLFVDTAAKQGIRVSEAQIDSELQRRAALNKSTVAALYQEAQKVGLSQKNYRLEVAKDLLVEHLQDKILDSVTVSESQINEYINQAQREGKSLPAAQPYTVYQIRRILLNINQNNTDTSVGQRMNQIVATLKQGADFGELAKRFSQEPAAANGGVLEVSEQSQARRVEDFLKTMQTNQVTVPIQTPQNWQVFQLLGKRTESDPTKTQREAVRRLLLAQEQDKARKQFVGQLQQSMVIREY